MCTNVISHQLNKFFGLLSASELLCKFNRDQKIDFMDQIWMWQSKVILQRTDIRIIHWLSADSESVMWSTLPLYVDGVLCVQLIKIYSEFHSYLYISCFWQCAVSFQTWISQECIHIHWLAFLVYIHHSTLNYKHVSDKPSSSCVT